MPAKAPTPSETLNLYHLLFPPRVPSEKAILSRTVPSLEKFPSSLQSCCPQDSWWMGHGAAWSSVLGPVGWDADSPAARSLQCHFSACALAAAAASASAPWLYTGVDKKLQNADSLALSPQPPPELGRRLSDQIGTPERQHSLHPYYRWLDQQSCSMFCGARSKSRPETGIEASLNSSSGSLVSSLAGCSSAVLLACQDPSLMKKHQKWSSNCGHHPQTSVAVTTQMTWSHQLLQDLSI